MTLADRLRSLAEHLPPGGSLTLTRDGLLDLADGGHPDQPAAQADFTVADVAAHFHRSPSTVRDWCEHGRFEGAYKLNGRDWRIPQAAVDAFLVQQRGQPRQPRVKVSAWRGVRSSK